MSVNADQAFTRTLSSEMRARHSWRLRLGLLRPEYTSRHMGQPLDPEVAVQGPLAAAHHNSGRPIVHARSAGGPPNPPLQALMMA